MDNQHCRFCGHELKHTFADLGLSPLSNEYLKQADLDRGQMFYPLNVKVCGQCFLVQAAQHQRPEQIFGDYQYFSSYSGSWLAHCKAYVDQIVPRLSLGADSRVLEIACNDGYLLQYFQPYGIPVKGIEPAENVAQEARKKGIEVECRFFGVESAREIAAKDGLYDLVIGNNVLAHVPDINSFVEGLGV
ncbi:MAG: methyltransferase domain-containing protein, partial [Oscillospiraceae bacterium]